MPSIRIGEMYYAHLEEAMVQCDCGHVVLTSQAEETWRDGKVTEMCTECFFSNEGSK